MKYVSVDIETTGLNPYDCHILEIGAIIEDTEKQRSRNLCPTFHCFVNRKLYEGSLFALDMNAKVLHEILEAKTRVIPYSGLLWETQIVTQFKDFLNRNGAEKPIFAGKNFAGFDLQFLKMLPGWETIKYRHRTLDPTLAFIDWAIDEVPPDTTTCLQRAGLPETVNHRALDDAWDIIELIRRITNETIT